MEQGRVTELGHHKTGRTTRLLWRALLYASEVRESRVRVVSCNNLDAWLFDMLCKLAEPVEGTRCIRSQRRLRLPNGSTIEVWPIGPAKAGDGLLADRRRVEGPFTVDLWDEE